MVEVAHRLPPTGVVTLRDDILWRQAEHTARKRTFCVLFLFLCKPGTNQAFLVILLFKDFKRFLNNGLSVYALTEGNNWILIQSEE